MRSLILFVLLAAAVVFGYPPFNEGASGACDALERVAVRVTLPGEPSKPGSPDLMLGQLLQGISKGQFAMVAVRNSYPDLPVTPACALLYWRALLDPAGFRRDALSLR